MKKRTYRATYVNKIDEAKINAAVKGKRVVVGVDVAKDVNYARLMVGEQREVVATVKWHLVSQTTRTVEWFKSMGAERVEFALEPSGTYGDPLVHQLMEAQQEVFQVSPKRCHDAAEVYDGVPSMHDAKAADIIARMHLDGLSQPWRVKSEVERDFAAAVDVMGIYDRQYHDNVNRIEALLARHWPELTGILELTSASLLALLETYGGPAAVRRDRVGCAEYLAKAGRRLLSEKKIEQVVQSASSTIGVPMTGAEIDALKAVAKETNRCRKAAAEHKHHVERLSESHEMVKQLSSVLGRVTAAVLVVGAGDPRSYSSAKAYVKALGLNLRERSSGKHKGQLKITKRGPSEPRRYLYMTALRHVKDETVIKAWYARKVAHNGKRSKTPIIVALMRKLVAALWHVARGSEFDPRKLFDCSRFETTTQGRNA